MMRVYARGQYLRHDGACDDAQRLARRLKAAKLRSDVDIEYRAGLPSMIVIAEVPVLYDVWPRLMY